MYLRKDEITIVPLSKTRETDSLVYEVFNPMLAETVFTTYPWSKDCLKQSEYQPVGKLYFDGGSNCVGFFDHFEIIAPTLFKQDLRDPQEIIK